VETTQSRVKGAVYSSESSPSPPPRRRTRVNGAAVISPRNKRQLALRRPSSTPVLVGRPISGLPTHRRRADAVNDPESGYISDYNDGAREEFESLVQHEFERACNEAYKLGREEGYESGLERGYEDGYEVGQKDRDKAGYERGHKAGHAAAVKGKNTNTTVVQQVCLDTDPSYVE